MRTRLHRKEPKQGHWVGAQPAFYPWKRVLIAIAIIVAIMATAVIIAGDANAAPSYTCVNKTSTATAYAGSPSIVVGRATFYATGCYWNDNVGVKSLTLTVDGYGNAPYDYVGVISSWSSGAVCGTWSNCNHYNNHLVIKGKRVKWQFCLPFAGCVSTNTPGKEVVFDSYGNMSFRAV